MGGDLGFAIIGCGGIGRLHAKVLGAVPGARLVAVADVDPGRAAALAAESGTDPMTVDEVLASDAVEALSICTPSGLHADLGIRAARAGKHVLVEKPIDVSLEAADRLLDACSRSGRMLGVIAQHRFDDSSRRLRAAIDSGALGDLLYGTAQVRWWRAQSYYDSADWRGTRRLDGGALLNQGVHYVDLMLWLFGPPRRVFARCATLAHRMECEDTALATVEFASGALGTIEVTTAAYPGFPEMLSVTGAKGTVAIEGTDISTWSLQSGDDGAKGGGEGSLGAAADPANLSADSHERQYEDFVTAVREGRPPAVTGVEGRRALELIVAAYESQRTGLPVDLPLQAVTA